MSFQSWGVASIGFVFGYLLFYSVRHTPEFNIQLLSVAIGAVGGGTVIGLVGKVDGWIGPYGVGLLAGFVVYGVVALIFARLAKGTETDGKKTARRALIGGPEK